MRGQKGPKGTSQRTEEWDRDYGEGRAGQHVLDGRAGGLEGMKGGEIKTGGGDVEVNSRD